MQLSCQQSKNIPFDRYIPVILIFTLCPLVLFFQRYSVIILTLAAVWSITYLRKVWTANDIHNILAHQITPKCQFERYLNYGLFVTTLFDFFRPFSKHTIELQIFGILVGGFLWWHAIRNYEKADNFNPRLFLFYGVLFCCLLIILDYLCGSLLVKAAEKVGKGRALIFSKVGMTLSIAAWPILYNQPFWKATIFCALITLILPILDCDTAILCILLGLVAYGVASIKAKLFWRFIQAKIIIICLTLPFAFNTLLTDQNIYEINKKIVSFSYIHRLYIWQYTSSKILESPLIGFGLGSDTADPVAGKIVSKPFYYTFKNGEGDIQNPIIGQQIPRHPHNMILQWWLEFGFIGALWWTALLVFLVEKIRMLETPARKVAFSFFTSNIVIILFSISFWQSWWWATWLFLLPLLTISRK